MEGSQEEEKQLGQILNKGNKENKSLQRVDCQELIAMETHVRYQGFHFCLNDERDRFIYSKNKSTIVRVCKRLEIGYIEKSMRKKVILFHPMCRVKKVSHCFEW